MDRFKSKQRLSVASEAALGQLGLMERNDLATIAKVIIGLAKEGERDAGRLCALALSGEAELSGHV